MNWTAHLPVWREILVALLLVVALYMLWLLWKMWRLNRVKPPPTPTAAPSIRDEPTLAKPAPRLSPSVAVGENDELPLVYAPPFSSHRAERHSPLPKTREGEPVQKSLFDGVSKELKELREEVEILRDSFSLIRDEMEMLRSSLQNTQVAQNASPLYKEAMQMAILGHDALTISERCGISRAEADLVVSMMKNGKP